MGLPSTPYFLCFHPLGLSWPILNFPHHILPMVCFFLSFRAPLNPFTSLRPFFFSHGPAIHYSYHLGLMGFLSICQLFSIRVAGLLLSTWASKMAVNRQLAIYQAWRAVLVPWLDSSSTDRVSIKVYEKQNFSTVLTSIYGYVFRLSFLTTLDI